MNWIEHFFGINPDNGDGSLESILALVSLAALGIAVNFFAKRRRHSRRLQL
jgi:hypothetical protein